MAAGRLVVPGWTPAVNVNGVPIPNAQMFFYLNRTTTLATIYADEALTVPLANPILANSAGQWPPVWADDANLFSVAIDASYGPPGVPFTFDDLGPSTSSNAGALNKLDRDAGNSETTFSDNALYTPPTPATYTRPIGDKFNEARSAFDFVPFAVSQEIKDGTYTGEINTEFQAMLDSGENLLLPQGSYPIDTDGFTPVLSTNGQRLIGQGRNSKLVNQVVAGTPARPAFIITGNDVELANFEVKANTRDCVNPTMAAGQIAFGVAVLVMGDRSHVHNMVVRDSWDGGIAIGRYNLTTGVQSDGAPNDVLIDWCQTFNTGRGIQTQNVLPVMAGSGFNNLLGQGVRITNCSDYGSTQGFIVDYAGGAFTLLENCRSYGARKSTAPGGIPNAGGQGFYIGAVATMLGCEAIDAEGDGFWLDGYSFYCIGRGLRSKGCKQRGLLMEGRDNDIDIAVDICSYENPGAWPAVQLRGSSATSGGGFTDSTGQIIRAQTTGGFHSYGLDIVPVGEGGSLAVSGVVAGGSLQGATAPIRNGQSNTFKEVGWVVRGADQIRDNGVRFHRRNNASSVLDPFGGDNLNGTYVIADATTPTKRMGMGYDPINDWSAIQSVQAGVSVKPLALNPAGGDIRTGSGQLQTQSLRSTGTTSETGVVGDGGGGVTSVIRTGSADSLAVGVAPSGAARIQAVTPGVSVRPLKLNDGGGLVQVGLGTWDNPMRFGASVYLWVDASTKLRIKNGAPASDTDGTVVGAQT